MKYYLNYLFLLSTILMGCAEAKEELVEKQIKKEKTFWTPEKEQRHLLNRKDSTTWDKEMFKTDLEVLNLIDFDLPFEIGVYPTPSYDLIGEGSFKGVGNFAASGGEGYEKKIGDKTILYNSFFVGASDVTLSFVGNKKNRVFFQILLLTDFVDTLNYSHFQSQVVSRNHPDYIGEGFFKTKNNRIDYTAFLASNQDAYAIINMRMFDLSKGNTILIAPQKDKSLRSLQLHVPSASSEEIDSITDEFLKDQEVKAFFQYQGNI